MKLFSANLVILCVLLISQLRMLYVFPQTAMPVELLEGMLWNEPFKFHSLVFEQNANGVNSIIFCTKCSLLGAKSRVGNMELCPKYLKGSWPLLFLDHKHLHFSKAGAISDETFGSHQYTAYLLCACENLEMSSFSLRPSWICEPS